MDKKLPLPVVLVSAKDYIGQIGQVAELEAEHLVWITGMEKIQEPPNWKANVDTVPVSDVTSITYTSIFGIAGILSGILSALVGVAMAVAMISGGFISFWMIGAAPVLVIVGLFFIIGCRRHRLVFACKDREIPWISAAMEYKPGHARVADVLRWAQERQVRTVDFPPMLELLEKSLGS